MDSPEQKIHNLAYLNEKLSDPIWRIFSGELYKIVIKDEKDPDAEGLVLPFKPNRAQRRFLKRWWNRNIILKARQLGFTTLICILWLDFALFNANVKCGIIAQDDTAAKNIFHDKIEFAYDNLPDGIKARFPTSARNAHELEFAHNGSSIRVATSMRSGTYHRLHVSEFGKICAKYPAKAKEVTAGSIPTVPASGILVIESTAEGRDGAFYRMTQAAIKVADANKKLTVKNYRFHFFAWFEEPDYRLPANSVIITADKHDYFDSIESRMKVKIDNEQRAWYVATEQEFIDAGADEAMLQEYPSCVSENTYVSTNNGLIRIKDIVPDGINVLAKYEKGIKPVFELTTKLGYQVICTNDHPILCADGVYRKLENLNIGEALQLAQPKFGTEIQYVSYEPNKIAKATVMIDDDFARFIGIFMGDGSFYKDTISIACDAIDVDMINEVERLMIKYIGNPNKRTTGNKNGCVELRCSRIALKDVFYALDLIRQNGSLNFKRKIHVPEYIMQSPKNVVAAFLSGLFEADGFAARDGTNIKFFSKYGEFCHDVQLLLLAFEIESNVKCRAKKAGNGSIYNGFELVLRANGTRKFAEEIKFISERKQQRAELSLNKQKTGSNANFNWSDPIDSIKPAGQAKVYDITTNTHNFIAGGIVVHNCPEEAFQRSLAGTYYSKEMTKMRKEGRICKIPILETPCNTFWDIGGTAGTALWVIQTVGMQDRAIDYYEAHNESYAHFMAWLNSTGYLFNKHLLPHDADHKRQGVDVNKSPRDYFEELGMKNIEIVPVITNLEVGINLTKKHMAGLWIDEDRCKLGIDRLDGYKRKWDSVQATWRNEPEKNDGNSEGADALRQYAQAKELGMLNMLSTTTLTKRPRNWRTI